MSLYRNHFFRHLAQTSQAPLALEISSAEGLYLYDTAGKCYLDLISGISVSSTGHRHPRVVEAIQNQLRRHLHVMVYGEFIQHPQVMLATRLATLLPSSLSNVYFVNSGSEAVEGALKLAKRHTGRQEIIAFSNAYHGSTHGALSVTGNDALKKPFCPLLPLVKHLRFNHSDDLNQITSQTACVIVEPVQGEAGIIPAQPDFLSKLRKKCSETGALLIFDEIQTGIGRTGSLFAFEKYDVIPDILLLAKAFGGGLPLGAFISSQEIMHCLTHEPALGHISTFGGHPLSCAAALANLEVVIEENLISGVEEKALLFINELKDLPGISEIRHAGLMMALQLENEEKVQQAITKCLENGLLTDWFLFRPDAIRIAPPLIIEPDELKKAAAMIRKAL